MSTLVPPILPTYTSFPYKISPAFPVRFSAFPHKMNDTLSCPQRKRGQKPERDTILSRSFAVRIHKGTNILPPNSLSAHKRRNKRRQWYIPLIIFRIRKGQYIIPLCTVYLRERNNIMSPHFYCVSPRISQEGQYIAPLIHFPSFIWKGHNIVPLMHDSLKNGVIRETI